MTIARTSCALILPYFGKFHSYFPLFLRTLERNPSFTLLLFTDCDDGREYPANVEVHPMTFDEFRHLASLRLGVDAALGEIHDICDFKPAYGLIFEEYLVDFDWWGYCDCDLLFGDLEKLCLPLMEGSYDKLFAMGHMTLFRNTRENNRRFMKPLHGEEIWRKALGEPGLYVFDEDTLCRWNPEGKNIHSLFIEDGAKVFSGDLAAAMRWGRGRLSRQVYVADSRSIERDSRPVRYYWDQGRIVGVRRAGGVSRRPSTLTSTCSPER